MKKNQTELKFDFKGLSRTLGLEFKNLDLFREALTHRSFLNENRRLQIEHNERLEFLGDAVLELVTTEHLFKNYPNPEGELTNWRAALVNGEMLSKIAVEIEVEKFLLMSRGEKRDTGKARQYLLANCMEAIIGAIYLDQGYEAAARFIGENILVKLPEILETKSYLDAKSYFQEKAQEVTGVTPHYEVIREWGPDHDKRFIVGVFIDKEKVAEAKGTSKQEAQRNAAAEGLKVKGWE